MSVKIHPVFQTQSETELRKSLEEEIRKMMRFSSKQRAGIYTIEIDHEAVNIIYKRRAELEGVKA